MKHAADAYAHWNMLPEPQKHDSWRLEILRAYSREKEKRVDLEARLEEANQDKALQKAQVERLSRNQQPREFMLKPPTQMSMSAETVRELTAASDAHQGWDFERLLSKWKGVVQDHRRSVSGMAGQRPLGSVSFPYEGFHFPRAGNVSAKTSNCNGDCRDRARALHRRLVPGLYMSSDQCPYVATRTLSSTSRSANSAARP